MEIRKASILIWATLVIEILIMSFTNLPNADYEFIGWIAVIVHSVITILLIQFMIKSHKTIFMFAFIIRVIFLFIDLYARNSFTLIQSGGDTEAFYKWAVRISEDLSLLSESSGGIYSKLIGRLFYLIGPIRIFAQYINVLLGLMVIMVLSEIFRHLKINKRITKNILLVASLFPMSVIVSAIFLREIIPTFFVALSLLFIIKWYKKSQGWHYVMLSFLLLGIASMFHSGVIGLALGYGFLLVFYEAKRNTLKMSSNSIVMFIGLSILFLLLIFQFGDRMFYKFANVEEMDDIYATAMKSAGGSAYLQGLETNNIFQFLIYSPIRAFYFLFSPLPMNWRGLNDIVGVLTDSIFYIWVTYYYFKNRKLFKNNPLITALIISIIGAAIIYGTGVGNAGTAMRHRQKLTPLFIVLVAVMMNLKMKYLQLRK